MSNIKPRLVRATKTLAHLLIIVGVCFNLLVLSLSLVASGIVGDLEPTIVLTIMSVLFWLAVWLSPKALRYAREHAGPRIDVPQEADVHSSSQGG